MLEYTNELQQRLDTIQEFRGFDAVLVVLVGAAVAAPQFSYRPAPTAAKPAAYPYVTPAYPYAAPAAYPYAAPAYPYPVQSYPFATAAYAKAPVYSAPVVKPVAPAAYAAPYNPQYVQPVAILRQSQDDNLDGSFSYDFESENGIASQASGFVKNAGSEAEAQVIQGQFSYTSPDGTPIVTRYYADETGFHAEGDHLPVAPPVPEAIAKSLAYQASLPPAAPAAAAVAAYKA